jgi:hypothetical protein
MPPLGSLLKSLKLLLMPALPLFTTLKSSQGGKSRSKLPQIDFGVPFKKRYAKTSSLDDLHTV